MSTYMDQGRFGQRAGQSIETSDEDNAEKPRQRLIDNLFGLKARPHFLHKPENHHPGFVYRPRY